MKQNKYNNTIKVRVSIIKLLKVKNQGEVRLLLTNQVQASIFHALCS